jgi:hypothetical protein
MALDKVQLTLDYRAIIAEDPITLVKGSSTLSCRKTKVIYAEKSGDYGSIMEYSFSVRAIVADFSSLPQTGDIITVGGVSRRVLAPGGEIDAAGISVLIHLGGIAQ